MSRLLHDLVAGLSLVGGFFVGANLSGVVSQLDPSLPQRGMDGPGAPLTPDEARAWADLVVRLRTLTGG